MKKRLMKTITLPVCNRAQYLAQTIESLSKQDLTGYKLFINADLQYEPVLKLINSIDFIETDIIVNESNLGVWQNPYNLIERVFKAGSNWNVHIEDDLIFSRDMMDLMNWYYENQQHNVLTYNAEHNDNIVDAEDELTNIDVKYNKWFSGYGWATNDTNWNTILKHEWWKTAKDYPRTELFPGTYQWDTNFCRLIAESNKGYAELIPVVRRSSTIGVTGATFTSEYYDKYYNHIHRRMSQIVKSNSYNLINKLCDVNMLNGTSALKTITLTVYNRPEYLKRTIESLSKLDLTGYKLFVNADTYCEPVIKIINDIDFIEVDLDINDEKLGVNSNTFNLLERTFKAGSVWNYHIEDDIILSADVLDLVNWYYENQLPNVITYGTFNYNSVTTLHNRDVKIHTDFSGYGWCITPDTWNILKMEWHKMPEDYSKEHRLNDYIGWDWNITRLFKMSNYKEIVPMCSRSITIGEIGTYSSKEHWDKWFKDEALSDVKSSTYYNLID